MNAVFSINRVWYIMRKDFVESRWTLLTRILAIGLVLAVLSFFLTYGHYRSFVDDWTNSVRCNDLLSEFYGFFLFCYLAFCIGNMNNRYAGKPARVAWLMLPATTLEKYVSRLLYAFVVLPLVLFCMVGVSEVVRVVMVCLFFDAASASFVPPMMVLGLQGSVEPMFVMMLLMSLSFFFYGSFMFRRGGFYKTALLGFGILILLWLTTVAVFYFNVEGAFMSGDSFSYSFDSANDRRDLGLGYYYVMTSLSTLFFLALPYWRMKEMEL